MMLEDRLCLISGGTGVIGRAIVKKLSEEGARVIVVGRNPDHVASVKDEFRADGFVADVSKKEDVIPLLNRVEEAYGKLDVLVTAAGIYGEIGTIWQCEPERWMDAIRVNLLGTMMMIKYALPLLKKSLHGRIIAFAGGGDGPLPHFSSYAASKGAILRFVESISQELIPFGISINAISPGLINSGFVQEILRVGAERAGEQKFKEAQAQISGTQKTVLPDRAAALIAFLASDQANGLTGKNFSAVWDAWEQFPDHQNEIMSSDIYNWRRIKPGDRGYAW